MRVIGTARIALFLLCVTGCAGTHSGLVPPGAGGDIGSKVLITKGQTQALLFNGLGYAYAQTVTYDTKFEGDVSASTANRNVATVDPPTQRSQHAPGDGVKGATFTVTPTGTGETVVTLADKNGGTATINVRVVGTHGVLVVNQYMNLIDEFAPGASGNATPSRVLQSGYTPRGIAYDTAGNLYVSSGASVEVYGPGSAVPSRFIRGSQTQLNCSEGIAVDGLGEAFVMNCGQVTVFGPAQDGNVAPARTLQVPGAGPWLMIACDAAGQLYVFHPGSPASIDVYAPGASGNAGPVRQITSAAIDGPASAGGIGLDAAGDVYVYVFGSGSMPNRIEVFAPLASGNSTPLRTITGPLSGQYLAVDQAGDVWTASLGWPNGPETLMRFAAGSNGYTTPAVQFTAPGLMQAGRLAVDPAGNPHVSDYYLDVVNGYSRNASGNATPISSLSLGSPGISQADGLALDANGALYVANGWQGQVPIYAAMQNGAPLPSRTIGAPPNLPYPSGVAVDAQGYIYAPNLGQNLIAVYAPGAAGGASPVRTIGGPNTGLAWPRQIALDKRGDLIVANAGNDSVTVYAAAGSGNVAPTAVIAGSQTGIKSPNGVAVDSRGAIYVANTWGASTSINVFAAGTTGNAPPSRSLSGSLVPSGFASLAVDSGDYLYALGATNVMIWQPNASGNVAPFMQINQPSTEGGFWSAIVTEP